MEKMMLKWSCSRSKFGQVNATPDTFKEVLGLVFNTTLELEIKVRMIHMSTSGPYNPVWDMFLNRNPCDEKVEITAKLISNNSVFIKDVIFLSGDRTVKLFVYDPCKLVDYHLDLFIIITSNATKDANLIEEYQITKLQSLSTNLQAMLEKEHMTDVILKCDSLTLKAHKSVLTIQSRVFESMFTSPMIEKESNTVTIKDIDSAVLRAMLNFMYSGQVKVESESMIYDLLYAAEKYELESLKEGCIEYLKLILSRENAIKILEISNLFDRELKLHCLNYVKNQFEDVKSTKAWKDLKLKNPVLALEVYSSNE